jgi:hypothetical protein
LLDVDYQLATTQPHALRDAVRALLGDPFAQVIDFRTVPLAEGAGNPTSAGLWRVSGFARSGGDIVEWSLVVKAVTLPLDTRFDHDDPRFLNYWLREIEAFRSPLLQDLPPGIQTPAYYGDVDLDLTDRHALLFMEDLGSINRASWDVEAYVFAARLIAAWHRPYLAQASVPDEWWLSDDVERRWVGITETYFDRIAALARTGYAPLAALNLETCEPAMRPLLRTIYEPESLLAPLDRLPHTLGHNDANIDNLVIRQGPSGQELVLFDIQWTGAAAVGTELAQLLCHVPMSIEGLTREQVEARIIDAYVEALNGDGAVVTREQVELGYAASASLRQFHFALALEAENLAGLVDAESGDEIRAKVATFIDNNLGGPLPRLAARAYALASDLEIA